MPQRYLLTVVGLAGLALAGCSTPSTTPPPATVTVTVPVPAPTAESAAATPSSAPASATSWTMPDVVGMNLQDAQDKLQRLTDYGVALSTSSDATGQGREQVMDRNWKVCAQDPSAGSTITSATVPDFAVVRTTESC